MIRATPPRKPTPLLLTAAVLACALLLPAAALASEGSLQLIPDMPLEGLADALGAPYGFRLVNLILLFVLLVAPVNRLVFQPLFRVLDARDEKISGTRARAQKLERDAEAILQRYETSVRETREEAERERRGLLEQVRAESQRTTAEVRAEAEGMLGRARTDVAAALDEARASLRGEAQALARQAASQVLGRAL